MTTKRWRVLLTALLSLPVMFCGGQPEEPSSMVFFFEPPDPFSNPEQYWDEGNHLVAPLTRQGVVREEGIRFEGPYLNFSQSAWDPKANALITWKKNFKGRDHLMRVSVPEMTAEPLARFPESGGSPLLAFDPTSHRVLVAPEYGKGLAGLSGGQLIETAALYDLESDQWTETRLEGIGLFTISFSEPLDRYVGLGRRVGPGSEPAPTLFHLDGDGRLIETVPTNLLDVLASPVSSDPSEPLGVNHPGLQSRVLGDELVLIRYVDLGRSAASGGYDWSYEMYAIDPVSGDSRFLQSFD